METAAPVSAPAQTAPETAPVEGQEQAPQGEGLAARAEALKKYKVKVDGEELEVDENELLTGYQTRKAADKKFREASMARKQAEEFVSLLKSDPIKLLSHPSIGHDVRKLAEEYLVSQLQEEALSPEQRELKDAKRKLQEYEEQEKQKAQAADKEKMEKLQAHYAEDYTNKIIGALESSTLPKTPMTIKRMAYYLHRGLEMGVEMDIKDVAGLVKQDYIDEQKNLFGALDEDTLVSLLDKDVLEKIRRAEVKKLKTRQPPKGETFVGDGSRDSKPKGRTLSKDDWKSKLDAIKNG